MNQDELQQWIEHARAEADRQGDGGPVELVERVTVAKYDKTSISEPGVEGLIPFEVVEIERRYPLGSTPGVVAPKESTKEG